MTPFVEGSSISFKNTQKKLKHEEVKTSFTVVYYVIRCPDKNCRSTDTFITRTDVPIRYHKCRACGINFKSVEKDPPVI